ncbi:MAG: CPBP family intramembrane metalloprotease [Chloroflexales bacterium]|nr:CPBP family intramembrane metalloprotease [Chloroflexales bacterium]
MDIPRHTNDTEDLSRLRGRQIGIAFIVLAGIYSIGLTVGGEVGQILLAGLQTLPFALLALLAYLGSKFNWAKTVTLLWLGLLVAGIGVIILGMVATPLVGALTAGSDIVPALPSNIALHLGVISIGSFLAAALGALGFVPIVRQRLSAYIPIEPSSFVQTIALVTIVALTLLCFLPLLVIGEPILLSVINDAMDRGLEPTGARSDAGLLLDTLYGLIWVIPGALIAVGCGVSRNLREALERIGLVRPSWRQVIAGLGVAVALVLSVQIIGVGIDWLWGLMNWPRTDSAAFEELLSFALNPLGAVVIGVTAGLGEELAIRGVLQPRLGILLSNLFFTSLHAFQYNWDALLVVFLVGVICGLVRRRSNTSTAAIVHGTYNFLLIILAVLNVPGFGQ